eukprot:gnl/TRDRNA2_/TRDRNA2_33802_c0_seq1.p1 gnl/TRDRNA2_/TRDRNA2_33802_c0~~gnl/TRDRNA2_/TRDRNA2_33802_c0_seq1.p1  ORF type:complete len:294 (-),score=85.73 gnl/TRDRNA2_/TRDRNA2_33802_c0_seq1:58-939(-)
MQAAVDSFIERNNIDERAAGALRAADKGLQQAVLDRGDLTNCVNPSTALMGRLRTAREESGTAAPQKSAAQQMSHAAVSLAPGASDPAAQQMAILDPTQHILAAQQQQQQQMSAYMQQQQLMVATTMVPVAVPLAPAPLAAATGLRQLSDGMQTLLNTVMTVLQMPEMADIMDPKHLQELGEGLQQAMKTIQTNAPLTLQRLQQLREVLRTAQQRHQAASQRLCAGTASPASGVTAVPPPPPLPTTMTAAAGGAASKAASLGINVASAALVGPVPGYGPAVAAGGKGPGTAPY